MAMLCGYGCAKGACPCVAGPRSGGSRIGGALAESSRVASAVAANGAWSIPAPGLTRVDMAAVVEDDAPATGAQHGRDGASRAGWRRRAGTPLRLGELQR